LPAQPLPICISSPGPRREQCHPRGHPGSPPFAFSRATATPQSKSPSTRESHETRSTANVETTATSSSPSGGSSTSSVPSPQDEQYVACPYLAANAPRQRQILSPLHQRAVLRPRGHDKRSRGTVGSCVVRALARKSYRSLTVRTTAHPVRDSLHMMAHSRRANANILFAYFLHLFLSHSHKHCSATSLARISGASCSRSRNTSSGSGGSSRHISHVSVSSASLALGRARAHKPNSGHWRRIGVQHRARPWAYATAKFSPRNWAPVPLTKATLN
jgi:hypothetical protein